MARSAPMELLDRAVAQLGFDLAGEIGRFSVLQALLIDAQLGGGEFHVALGLGQLVRRRKTGCDKGEDFECGGYWFHGVGPLVVGLLIVPCALRNSEF